MGDIDVMHHQVGEDPAAKIPEPAPIAETVFVERLIGSGPQKSLPIDRLGIDAVIPLWPPIGIAIPGEMHFADFAERSAAENVVGFEKLRHAPLLHPDLNHQIGTFSLRRDHRLPLLDPMG